MSDKKPVLELRNVDKSFGPIDVLHEISLKVREGEVLCLLGRSGCGKSTLLRVATGLERPFAGTVSIDGTPEEIAARIEADLRRDVSTS